MDSGNAVREAINQGFTRAELGSLADKQAIQVYHGAKAEGTVVASKCMNAIENYKAAVSCFLRALPSLTDARSNELVRNEIRRLLARLGELKRVLREADPGNELLADDTGVEDESNTIKNRLLQDLRFSIGDEVEVDSSRAAKIIGVDMEDGTYTVEYDDDGSREARVVEPRVRLRPMSRPSNNSLQFADENEAERYRLWSEVIESERSYQLALEHLVKHYVVPFDSSAQWAGAKSKAESVFTQTAITKDERQRIFANVEDLAGLSSLVLEALETRFVEWKQDQKLADVFLEVSSMYSESYPRFAETFAESLMLIKQCRQERPSFEAIEERARSLGAPPLEELLRTPLTRPAQCRLLLQNLARRTLDEHPDQLAIRDAFVMFGRLEESMRLSLDRAKLEKQVNDIELLFSPTLKLAKRGRYLLRYSDRVKRIEGSKSVDRCVWLFSDTVVVGRKSEWLNIGQYRFLAQLSSIAKARSAKEYGPLAFEISSLTESFVFVANDEHELNEWLKALRGFIPPVANPSRRKSNATKTAPDPSKARRDDDLFRPLENKVSKPSSTTAAAYPPVLDTPPPIITMKSPPATSAPLPVNVSTPPLGAMRPTAFTMAQQQTSQGSRSSSPGHSGELAPALGAATLRQKEILLQKRRTSETSPPRTQWRRVQAIADFEPMEIGDLSLRTGEILEVAMEETSPGWTKGRRIGGDAAEGAVPTNYIRPL